MAGSDKVYDALFKQTGVIRAESFSDLLDIPAALSSSRVLQGRRVAILTSTGGAGTLVSDALGLNGFETPAPDAETAARLRALQTGDHAALRSEEHTSELQSLMRSSYAVFCLKKKQLIDRETKEREVKNIRK